MQTLNWHYNSRKHVLWAINDFSTTNVCDLCRWARTSKSKIGKNRRRGDDNTPIRGHAPAELTKAKFSMRGRVADVIMFQILSKSVKGFPSCEEPNMGVFSQSPLQTCQHYRAACDGFH